MITDTVRTQTRAENKTETKKEKKWVLRKISM
jgi:hypothetical protein